MAKLNVLEEILSWSPSLPKWLSDALRRIFQNGILSDTDLKEIVLLAKAEVGLDTEQIRIIAIPLDKTHISGHAEVDEQPILCSLSQLTNVNAIVEDHKLCFGEQGITVVFGENATGKSGYSRVLKKACKARHAEEIKPNVFMLERNTDKPSATFEIRRKPYTEIDKLLWNEGYANDSVFSHFAVFDSKCARVILEEENALTYVPYGLDVFKPLSNVLESVEAIVCKEADRLEIRPKLIQELIGDHEIGVFF